MDGDSAVALVPLPVSEQFVDAQGPITRPVSSANADSAALLKTAVPTDLYDPFAYVLAELEETKTNSRLTQTPTLPVAPSALASHYGNLLKGYPGLLQPVDIGQPAKPLIAPQQKLGAEVVDEWALQRRMLAALSDFPELNAPTERYYEGRWRLFITECDLFDDNRKRLSAVYDADKVAITFDELNRLKPLGLAEILNKRPIEEDAGAIFDTWPIVQYRLPVEMEPHKPGEMPKRTPSVAAMSVAA